MGFTKKTTYYTGTVYEFNLPTGWSCPFAQECLVKVDKETGKMENKSDAYRCYAASAERFPGVRNSRWNNFESAKKGEIPPLPKQAKHVRIHMSGDFFSQAYFDTWLLYCRQHPNVEFWAYTKSLKYWVERINDIPENLVLTASYGGRNDELIEAYNLKSATVVSKKEAGLDPRPVDHNDDLARIPNVSFLLIDNNER
jgi:hypothetical protein